MQFRKRSEEVGIKEKKKPEELGSRKVWSGERVWTC